VDYLHKEGHLSQEKVFERDSWSTKKKRKYANKITDKMEETKQIKSLYNDFKANVENARNAKVCDMVHQKVALTNGLCSNMAVDGAADFSCLTTRSPPSFLHLVARMRHADVFGAASSVGFQLLEKFLRYPLIPF
jgi:hypothetical protein